VWFLIWGLPLPGSDSDSAADGSLLDRLFYGGLAMIGLYVLSRRRVRWSLLAQENPWLVLLMAYLLLSCGWSDYPMVSIKRFVKLFGSVVMALVVLTEGDQVNAIATLIRRCAYVHIPMSILATRYFRDIGIAWDYMGTSSSWQGIASSKNVLGQIAMLSAICFIWERVRRGNPKEGRWIDFLYIAMSVYLLKGEESRISMTSITVFGLGLAVFLALNSCKKNAAKARRILRPFLAIVVGLLLLVTVHSIVGFAPDSLFGSMITTFGRDITLTGRTEIWADVYHIANSSPLFGVGFGGFWIGRMANIPWNAEMSWVLGQAHNGYIDAYLQGGLCGVTLLLILLFKTVHKIDRSFAENFEYARFCAVMFCVIMYVNITESTYLRGEHSLWLIFLLTALTVPAYAFDRPGGGKTTTKDAQPLEADKEPYRDSAAVP